MTALRKNRVNHAYLFSGPRGCGKTTSARILARCLNCAQGPTDTPCGTCPSCIELARGGSGSLDVIEIDAASHGGVDDARDLRERATFAPVRDRYKIFIIDEAHMVTSAGFNALLKIVEEPPEHIKFIFATTEPDKVIGTIRSRTHHYPFRLVPPEPLLAYLELLCQQENVPVAPGVLSLVIRAGGGSVRDTLSVLDQLMAGAGASGLDYELAVALLGYTHASLLDDVVDAIAASDSATVFKAVDRVIQTGHDPRRFVEDLLERFRDLIIVRAMPESAAVILRGMPADQIARLQAQAHNLGASELSRAADVTNTALTEMTGATSPRLHLELLCARILLPSAEQTERGIAARIDRVERRLNYAGNDVSSPTALPTPSQGTPDAGPAPTAVAAPAVASPVPAVSPAPEASAGRVNAPAVALPEAPAPSASVPAASAPSSGPQAPAAANPADSGLAVPTGSAAPDAQGREQITAPRVSTSDWPREDSPKVPAPAAQNVPPTRGPAAEPAVPPASVPPGPAPAAASAPPAERAPAPAQSENQPPVQPPAPQLPAQPAASGARGDVEVLRRAWPEVLQALSKIKRSTWALVEPNAKVAQFDGQLLTLAFTTSGLAGAFGRADHSENLRQAIHKTVGIDCQITAVAGGSGGSGPASSEPNPKAPTTPDVRPTSVDEAWGLVPSGSDSASAVVAPAAAPASAAPSAPAGASDAAAVPASVSAAEPASAAPAESTAPAKSAVQAPPATPVPAASTPAAAAAAAPAPRSSASVNQQAAASPAPTGPAAESGTSSYSDDDWGPPLDEDAPPLDEEPPMDWMPSTPVRSSSAPAAAGMPAGSSISTEGSGQSDGPAVSSAPATAGPAQATAGSAASAGVPESTVDDPWSRAVEHAPGVWQVGSTSNVGAMPAEEQATAQDEAPKESGNPSPSPAWQATPETSAPSAPERTVPAPGATEGTGLPSPSSSVPAVSPDSGWGSLDSDPTEPREPAYAMAGAAPAPTDDAPARTAEPAPAQSGRQSLYQRLSNSPEAQAGRARVAQAAAVAAPYVQDIPDPEDETIEESGVFGRAAVERILGGKLIEERSLDGSPLPPRF